MKDLYTALIKAQQSFPKITKGKEGYGYKYTELGELIEKVYPVLHDNGLGVSQCLESDENGRPGVRTVLFHAESQQVLVSEVYGDPVVMKGCNTAQGAGATFSYLRRYALLSILGLASEDNDAASEPVSETKKKVKEVVDTVNKHFPEKKGLL